MAESQEAFGRFAVAIITYFIEQKGDTETVYLVTIYEESVDKKELIRILEDELG